MWSARSGKRSTEWSGMRAPSSARSGVTRRTGPRRGSAASASARSPSGSRSGLRGSAPHPTRLLNRGRHRSGHGVRHGGARDDPGLFASSRPGRAEGGARARRRSGLRRALGGRGSVGRFGGRGHRGRQPRLRSPARERGPESRRRSASVVSSSSLGPTSSRSSGLPTGSSPICRAGILIELLPGLTAALESGSWLILSGVLASRSGRTFSLRCSEPVSSSRKRTRTACGVRPWLTRLAGSGAA